LKTPKYSAEGTAFLRKFTPAMVKAVFDELKNLSKNHFTVGIKDDVTNQS
jgi:hypothetical protein